MYRLLAMYGEEEQVFAIPEDEAKLGSASENDLVLRVQGVSRKHTLVRRLPGGVEVVDLGSKNGLLVEGQRVKQAVLTPGLRVQVGTAWLEIEEVSTSEEALARLSENPSERSVRPSPLTVTVESAGAPRSPSQSEAALTLAYHIARVGVGLPKQRTDLLLRIKAILEADAFATLETTRFGRLRIWEGVGTFSSAETRLLTSLAEGTRIMVREQLILKRADKTLLAGQGSWFLAATFPEELQARERWRKEFLRFLASQFFMPVRSLDEIDTSEVARVYALAGKNARRTADLLDVSPGKVYKFLRRLGFLKH